MNKFAQYHYHISYLMILVNIIFLTVVKCLHFDCNTQKKKNFKMQCFKNANHLITV